MRGFVPTTFLLSSGIVPLLMSIAVGAAEISELNLPGQQPVIQIGGEFTLGDERKFIQLALPHTIAIVRFGKSEGGNLYAAIEIGKAIKLKQFNTTVAENTYCASACAYAWLAGRKRYMESNAKVGFHAAYQLDSGIPKTSGSGNAVIGAYLNELALGTEAIIYITETEPNSMRWLDANAANSMGIPVEVTGVTATPVPPTTTSLWEHNGSTVSLESTGDKRKFVYEVPDADVPVRSGTLLFEGARTGDTFSGTAYRFSTHCDPVKYDVKGPVSSDQSIVTLFGKAPILSGCRIAGYRDDVLLFRYLQQSVSTEDGEWVVKDGFDLYGLDIGRPVLAADASACHLKCRINVTCKAYTFDTKHSMCFLKNDVKTAYRNSQAVSGFRATLLDTIKESPFAIMEGLDFPGSDFQTLREVTFDSCLSSCEETRACMAFSYVKRHESCWLKSQYGDSKARQGVTSGIKVSGR